MDPTKVVDKLPELQLVFDKKASRSSGLRRTSEFVEVFCGFASRTSNIVMQLLPQSPEYTVTFGMLCILFGAVVTKKDREESLLGYISAVSARLPLLDFYRGVFPTSAMKASVARLYVHVMQLLDKAVV